MRPLFSSSIALSFLMILIAVGSAGAQQAAPEAPNAPWLNPDLPIDQRVDSLVSQMTLEEKASGGA